MKNQLYDIYEKYMIVMGTVGHLLFVFQTIKMVQTGSSHDVSLVGFFISFVSLLSWLIYGLIKKDRALIIVNIFGTATSFACMITIWLLR